MSAFGEAADMLERGRVWCNLCRAEGRTFEIPITDDALQVMHQHSRMEHAEHEAALDRGETYIPVEVQP
jgi:hypothetical protein